MRPVPRRVLPILLLSSLAGCQGWHGRRMPSGPEPLPSPVRVLLRGGSAPVMWHPAVERDSLIGLVGRERGERTRAAVAVSQVERIEQRGVNVPATVGVSALGTLAAVFAVVLLALGATW
jgi:hypothetical protein